MYLFKKINIYIYNKTQNHDGLIFTYIHKPALIKCLIFFLIIKKPLDVSLNELKKTKLNYI